MAAISSVGGSVFFRIGSDQEKQESDRRKTKFCDEWGDMVTLVNVYREWDALPEKRRNPWCYENSINARSMRTAKSMVNEIVHTFRQELGITFPLKFSSRSDANEELAKILFECYALNLSRFSGHRHGGYCVASEPETVLHVHPSSALNYLEELPQWVVHETILVTSRTFLMNATFVEDAWVVERLNTGKLAAVDLCQLKQVLVERHPVKFVGSSCIRSLLTDKAKALKELENKIRLRTSNAKVFVDVSQFDYGCGGTVALYTNPLFSKYATDEMAVFVAKIRSANLNESFEQQLLSNNKNSVRFVIERGAQIRTILMPHETRVVKIKSPSIESLSESDVISELRKFGELEVVKRRPIQTKDPNLWGFLTYKFPQQALDAVSSYKAGTHNFSVELFSPEVSKSSRDSTDYMVKVIGMRRPIKEFGYIKLKDTTDVIILDARWFDVHLSVNSRLSLSDKVFMKRDAKVFGNMYLTHVPYWATPEVLKTGFLAAVGTEYAVENIVLPRAVVPSPPQSNRLLNLFELKIKSLLSEVSCNECRIEISPVRSDKDFDMRARLAFSDAYRANLAANHLNFKTFESRHLISASVELNVFFVVPMHIFRYCRTWFEEKIVVLRSEAEGPLRVDKLENANGFFMSINISTTHLSDLMLAKNRLGQMLNGQKLELDKYQLQNLQLESGKHLLELIQRTMNVAFRLDIKTRSVFIHGRHDDACKARERLIVQMKSFVIALGKDIQLSGGAYPKGLMKKLVLQFGPNLDDLRVKSNATSLELMIRGHIVRFRGNSEACDKVLASIDKVAEALRQRTDQNTAVGENEDEYECPVCLTPPEKHSIYVTECCSHIYCRECAVNLVQNAIRNNDIPIKCAAEACPDELALKDLQNLLNGSGGLSPVYQSAVQSFMMAHAAEFSYCITPNCPMIFRRAFKDAEGSIFVCSDCKTSLCTSCCEPYHVGFSCAVYRKVRCDDEMAKWLKADPANRSLCPNCGIGIEKNGGCQHMTCTGCKTHICWWCKKTFQEAGSCYTHMNYEHGNIYQ